MDNRAFWRALHSLAHPFSIGAILLLLFNDHVLRWSSPSWITGKLGDFAWLMFAPLICALVIAWFVPCKRADQDRIVGWIAFGLIGAWFALAKTVPLVHGWTLDALEAIIGYRATLRLDMTDLLALPALGVGWWVWTRADARPVNLRPLAYVALGLGIVGTLATSPAPVNVGITAIYAKNNHLYAGSAGSEQYVVPSLFESSDGGLTWRSLTAAQPIHIPPPDGDAPLTLADDELHDPTNPCVAYRIAASVERSDDCGRMWTEEYSLAALDQEVRFYYIRGRRSANVSYAYRGNAAQAFFDSETGNILFPMGVYGILMRLSSGEYRWVRVGEYQLDDISDLAQVPAILMLELFMGLAVFGLVTASLNQRIKLSKWISSLILAGWLIFAGAWLLVLPGQYIPSTFPVGRFPLATLLHVPTEVFAVVAFFVGLESLARLARQAPSLLRPVVSWSLLSALVYLLPYVLFAHGTVPKYAAANLIAAALLAITLFAGILHTASLKRLHHSSLANPPLAD